jgi:hypothetical protein
MSQALPVGGFRWLEKEEFEHLNINSVSDDSEDGYVLEVDLDYPPELHDHHNEYPLAPEKMKVTENMLSPYAKQMLEELELKGTSTEKLIPNLHPKEKYVVHYRNLKLYLSLGMRLTMIHRVMTFKQQPWLKTYIDFNTQKRKMANNEFEKDFFQTHEQRRVWKNDGKPTQETYSPVGKQPIKSQEAHQQAYWPFTC